MKKKGQEQATTINLTLTRSEAWAVLRALSARSLVLKKEEDGDRRPTEWVSKRLFKQVFEAWGDGKFPDEGTS